MKTSENLPSNPWTIGALALFIFANPVLSDSAKKIDFAHDIVPILKTHCVSCHTNGKYKGSFSLDTRETILKKKAITPGKSGESELFKRISSDHPEKRMPPKGIALSEKERGTIQAWIDEGMGWEQGFSFRAGTYVAPLKPRRPTLPTAQNGREHPIDRILDAYFGKNKIMPSPALDDGALLRRLSLDVIGLLPTPEEVDAFGKDKSANKVENAVRQLLEDRRGYSDHWLTFWNDLLRNDYAGTGYIDGGRKQISNWLYNSLLENKPYDQFVRELINPNAESEGFIKGIQWRGNVNASQVVELQFAQNISQVFFGVNMKCASCHDSFIDGWKLEDAYSLAAVVAEKPLEIHRCDKPQGTHASPRFLFPDLGVIDAKAPKQKRLEQLAALVTHADNGRFTRTIANRIWQRLMGRGIVQPVDIMAGQPWSEDLLDYLAVYLSDQKYDLKKLIEHIISSRAYQAQAVAVKEDQLGAEYVFRGPELKRLTAEQFMDAIWMLTKAGPTKADAPMRLPDFQDNTPADRRFIRASLVKSNSLLRALGRPNREQVVTTRPDQLSTLQALALSNGQFVTDLLSRGAGNLLKADPKSASEVRIEGLYLRALSRKPTGKELPVALELVGSPATAEGLADLLWVIVMLPEFQLVR